MLIKQIYMPIGEKSKFRDLDLINYDNLLNQTSSYHLSIEIFSNQINYSLFNIKKLEHSALRSVYLKTNEVSELVKKIGSEELLKQNYASSTLSYSNFDSTIIPNSLFIKKDKSKYLNFISDEYGIIKSDPIHQLNATIIYSIPNRINKIIKDIQPNIIEKNSTTILIDQIIKQYKYLNKKTVFLILNKNKIEVLVIKEDKLFLNNIFSYSNEIDILYYILYIYEQLDLDTKRNQIFIYGDIEKKDKLFLLLYKYIQEVKFGIRNESTRVNDKIKSVKKHEYYALFSQITCV